MGRRRVSGYFLAATANFANCQAESPSLRSMATPGRCHADNTAVGVSSWNAVNSICRHSFSSAGVRMVMLGMQRMKAMSWPICANRPARQQPIPARSMATLAGSAVPRRESVGHGALQEGRIKSPPPASSLRNAKPAPNQRAVRRCRHRNNGRMFLLEAAPCRAFAHGWGVSPYQSRSPAWPYPAQPVAKNLGVAGLPPVFRR